MAPLIGCLHLRTIFKVEKKNRKKICGCLIEFLVAITNGHLVIKAYENHEPYPVTIMKLLH